MTTAMSPEQVPAVRSPENPIRKLIRTSGLLERVSQPYFARFGISGSQWGVLRNLYRAEQEGLPGLRLTDLCGRLLTRPPSITGLVDRLQRAGLVVRGGSPKATDLTARERHICERLGPHLRERGLLLVGIDVIGDYLTEINVTSPTGIRAVRNVGGPDIAKLVWDRIEGMRRG